MVALPGAAAEQDMELRWQAWVARGAASDRRSAARMRWVLMFAALAAAAIASGAWLL